MEVQSSLPRNPWHPSFDIDSVFKRLRKAVAPYKPAMLFQLYDEGHVSPFEILVACILSIRTFDEISLVESKKLFAKARNAAQLSRLTIKQIDDLISKVTFHGQKAPQLKQIATLVENKYGGELPADEKLLLSLPGVGPKCSNLVLGITSDQPRVGVDIHVHRVTNRWGYVSTTTPEKTMIQLEKKLPKKYWVEINRLLVPFGKHVCTGTLPKCSTCPLLRDCARIGVSAHR